MAWGNTPRFRRVLGSRTDAALRSLQIACSRAIAFSSVSPVLRRQGATTVHPASSPTIEHEVRVSGGCSEVGAVKVHLRYIGRQGRLSVLRKHLKEVATQLVKRGHFVDPVGERLRETRRHKHDWIALAEALDRDGDRELSAGVRRFVDHMPRAETEKEQIAQRIHERVSRERGDAIGGPRP